MATTSSTLDSIWDDPIAPRSPRKPGQDGDSDEEGLQKSMKRSRQALFLADSDEEVEASSRTRITRKAPPVQDVDIDAYFEDLSEEDDGTSKLKQRSRRIDEAEMSRRAEAEAIRQIPTLTPHQIMPSSSPSKDTGNFGNKQTNGREKRGDGDEKKERRRLAKLDENRLLSPTGFPELIKMTKNFRTKGKGHEAIDLNRLLQMYHHWTHRMYPKTQFRDTVERVEKLCHSRRMTVSLSVWRDEAHGKPQKDFLYPDSDDDDAEADDVDQVNDEAMHTEDRNPNVPRSSPSHTSLRGSSPPASGASSEVDVPSIQMDIREEDEEENFWRSMEDFNGDISDPPPAPASAASMDEDEDMWDIIDEVEKEAVDKHSTAEQPNQSVLDDVDFDDMYV